MGVKYVCNECGAEMTAKKGLPAKYCVRCGSKSIDKPESLERQKNYAEKDAELDQLCIDMNNIYASFMERKAQYDKIMEYWRAQLHRKLITQEEYENRASKFAGYAKKGVKK